MARRITINMAWYTLVILVLVLIVLVLGSSFFSYKLYQKVVATEDFQKQLLVKQENERLIQEQKSKDLIELQQQALSVAQLELAKTKTENQKNAEAIKTLTATVADENAKPKAVIISSSDLASIVSGVVQVLCVTKTGIASGSGSLWNFKEVPYAVLTNYHVIKDAEKCVISITNSANEVIGVFNAGSSIYTFNKDTDQAVLSMSTPLSSNNVPVANYNYSLSTLRKCPNNFPVGSPVVIVGFPAYAKRDATVSVPNVGTVHAIYRTTTNGIISGYDSSTSGNPNYFVSAKIDNGNSGGIALAKDAGGLCSLGLPTWLSVGNYETQGLVQNITNVLP